MRRERHNLSMLTAFTFAPNHVRLPLQTTGLVSASPESQPSSPEARTQLTAFSQIPKSSAHASGHDVPHIAWSQFLSGIFILTSLNDTSSPRAWTPALTNQCAKRKVLSLTKPKGKIYKTKPLGNYITHFKYGLEYLSNGTAHMFIP